MTVFPLDLSFQIESSLSLSKPTFQFLRTFSARNARSGCARAETGRSVFPSVECTRVENEFLYLHFRTRLNTP